MTSSLQEIYERDAKKFRDNIQESLVNLDRVISALRTITHDLRRKALALRRLEV